MTNNTRERLVQALRHLARARKAEKRAAEQYAKAKAALEATPENMVAERAMGLWKEARAQAELQEEDVRLGILYVFAETDNKKPVPGTGVRLIQKVRYDIDAALAWCKGNAPTYLTLDVRRFEKAALDGLPGAPVEIRKNYQATIGSDLSMYLEEAE